MEINPELIICYCGFPLILIVSTLAVLFVIWLIRRDKTKESDHH
jgi:hypothetical protein